MVAAEANTASISSTTKLVFNDASDKKMAVGDFSKIVDKVPPRPPSIFSHHKLLNDDVDERKMAAKDSKINAAGSIIQDYNNPILDSEDINNPPEGVHFSLRQHKDAINLQETASSAM